MSFEPHPGGTGRLARKRLVALCLATALALALPLTAAAATLVNGSFEQGPAAPAGTFVNLNGGSTVIPGWTVTGSTIDYIAGYWQAADGTRSIDLDGSSFPYTSGGVAQTFATTPGLAYSVHFDLAGNPNNGPAIKPMRVSAAGQSADFQFDISGHTITSMGWVGKTWLFTATAASTTLEFRSLNPANADGWGAALDNVSVSAVPEPAAGALMLCGAALLLARRRG